MSIEPPFPLPFRLLPFTNRLAVGSSLQRSCLAADRSSAALLSNGNHFHLPLASLRCCQVITPGTLASLFVLLPTGCWTAALLLPFAVLLPTDNPACCLAALLFAAICQTVAAGCRRLLLPPVSEAS